MIQNAIVGLKTLLINKVRLYEIVFMIYSHNITLSIILKTSSLSVHSSS